MRSNERDTVLQRRTRLHLVVRSLMNVALVYQLDHAACTTFPGIKTESGPNVPLPESAPFDPMHCQFPTLGASYTRASFNEPLGDHSIRSEEHTSELQSRQ